MAYTVPYGKWYVDDKPDVPGWMYSMLKHDPEINVDYPIIKSDRRAFKGSPLTGHKDNPIKFQKPNRNDAVFFATIPVLRSYNGQDFDHQHDPLIIKALSLAPTLFYEWDTTSAVHCLTRYDTYIKVQLKLKRGLAGGWEHATVVVRDDTRWVPLQDWLLTLPKPSKPGLRELTYEEQYKWWPSNGKVFNFLKLPKELQRRIMLFAIGEMVEPDFKEKWTDSEYVDNPDTLFVDGNYKKASSLMTGSHRDYYSAVNSRGEPMNSDWTKLPPNAPVNIALFLLNKELNNMTRDVLWNDTTKSFRGFQGRSRGFRDRRQYGLAHITTFIPPSHLSWHFPRKLIFVSSECTGPPMFDAQRARQDSSKSVFKQLPSLQYLELYFESTISSSYNPWNRYHHIDPSHPAFNPAVDYTRMPCYEKLVDHVLTFAAEYIMHIPTVELTGYIKTEIKRKWEKILNGESGIEDVSKWLEEEKQAIFRLPITEFPLRCFCPQHCSKSEVFELEKVMDWCRDSMSGRPKPWEWKDAYASYTFDFDDKVPPGRRIPFGEDDEHLEQEGYWHY